MNFMVSQRDIREERLEESRKLLHDKLQLIIFSKLITEAILLPPCIDILLVNNEELRNTYEGNIVFSIFGW